MIKITNLALKIGDFSLEDINLTIKDREYLVILGPTGAGKTVLMECLAGLHKIKQGSITIDDVDVTKWPPEQRRIGYVPQDYVLFPFLNVRDNIVFGLKQGRQGESEIDRRLATLTELLGIDHLLARDTQTLSGGEKQRVALARALAIGPRILLLDEPLSALDVRTSNYLRLELRRIHHELGVTTVHITHNQAEAGEMADRMAVMISGRVVQTGRPQDIFFQPDDEAVSSFTGISNVFECDWCRELVPGLIEAECRGMRIVLPYSNHHIEKIAISPHDVYVSTAMPPGSSVNCFRGVVSGVEQLSATARLTIEVDGVAIMAEMPSELATELHLVPGSDVYVVLKLRRLKVLGNSGDADALRHQWYYQGVL